MLNPPVLLLLSAVLLTARGNDEEELRPDVRLRRVLVRERESLRNPPLHERHPLSTVPPVSAWMQTRGPLMEDVVAEMER